MNLLWYDIHLDCETPGESGYIDQRSLYINIYIYIFKYIYMSLSCYLKLDMYIHTSPITNVFDCRKPHILRMLARGRTLLTDMVMLTCT